MFGRRLSNASRKNKSQWYEWPILIAVTTAALALIGQFMVTLLPIWSTDTGDFYISVKPVPIEAKLVPYEILPTNMENWSQLIKEPQSPNAKVEVQDLNSFIKNYRHPVFLKSDDKYNKIHNLIVQFRSPATEPPFTAELFVYTTNTTESIENLPITIEGIGGDGKRRNCTVYILYKSPKDLVKEGLIQAILGNYSGSIDLFDKSIEINPSYALAWKNKGIVLSRYLNDSEDGLICIDRALDLNSNDEETWYVKGAILLELGFYNESSNCLDHATDLNPNHARAWSEKGLALDRQHKYEEAIKASDEAIRLDPTIAAPWNNKGLALNGQEKYDEAIKVCDEAIWLDPTLSQAWSNKGIALTGQGKYNEAIKAFDEAIRLDPNFVSAWIEKSIALYDQGKFDEAIRVCDEAIHLNPSRADAWYIKGLALNYQYRYDEAINAFNEAIRLDPSYADAWNNKGLALKALGRTTEADAAFARARELGGN
jgi:tetratricopeptide (TPR) repeat protein